MKKHLLASTALAAVGALALSGAAVAQDKKMKPSLTVSGAWEANVGVGDNDVDGQDGIGVQQDVEVQLQGQGAAGQRHHHFDGGRARRQHRTKP